MRLKCLEAMPRILKSCLNFFSLAEQSKSWAKKEDRSDAAIVGIQLVSLFLKPVRRILAARISHDPIEITWFQFESRPAKKAATSRPSTKSI